MMSNWSLQIKRSGGKYVIYARHWACQCDKPDYYKVTEITRKIALFLVSHDVCYDFDDSFSDAEISMEMNLRSNTEKTVEPILMSLEKALGSVERALEEVKVIPKVVYVQTLKNGQVIYDKYGGEPNHIGYCLSEENAKERFGDNYMALELTKIK